jgi:hypothetical protein
MTFDDRVQAVAKKGFNERQARFLTTVMLHAGVCVPRQYARFCGIVYGAKRRAVLPGSRRFLSTSIQGPLRRVEAGRRGGFRGLQL